MFHGIIKTMKEVIQREAIKTTIDNRIAKQAAAGKTQARGTHAKTLNRSAGLGGTRGQ
jgi:hypothetical protein